VCVSVCVCVSEASIAKWLGHQLSNCKVENSIPGVVTLFSVVVVVSLSKELYSHCSSLPSGKWRLGVD